MIKLFAAITLMAGSLLSCQSAFADFIWINEIHYDNIGVDTGEFVEIAIRTPNGSGFDPSDYAIEFYNGANGNFYGISGTLDTFSISNSFGIANSSDTITLFAENFAPIQNGIDGIALVNVANNTVIQFLSYEGVFTADGDTGGIAGTAGAISTNIAVGEPGIAPVGSSIGAAGTGDDRNDFDASSFQYNNSLATPGTINNGQLLIAVPEPAVAAIGIGFLTLAFCGFRGRRRGTEFYKPCKNYRKLPYNI